MHSESSRLPSPIQIRLVGVKHTPHYPELFFRLQLPRRVKLQRESNNLHDPNAIAVRFGDKRLGYIPAQTAKRLASELDEGERWVVWLDHIEEHPAHPDSPAVWLQCQRAT